MTTNHTPELDALLHQAMEADFQAEKVRKSKNFQHLNKYIKKGQILFTGSSLMEHFPVAELYAESDLSRDGLLVYDRGIGGLYHRSKFCVTSTPCCWIWNRPGSLSTSAPTI